METYLTLNQTYHVDCLEGACMLPDSSIDCIVTSPPYFGLRDYGVAGQIGLEASPQEYIDRLVSLFSELRRALKPSGTLWVVIGDTYNGYKGNANNTSAGSDYAGHRGQPTRASGFGLECKGLKPKDLIGIPWMLAFAMRADGWYLRQDLIWSKPNCTPESVKDRCTKSHEYIFLFSRKAKYYFDYQSIQTPTQCERDAYIRPSVKRAPTAKINGIRNKSYCLMANKRSVWHVVPKPFKEAHFATYPEELIVDCIKAGCPADGVVLDPFHGSGTTGIVANKLGRHYLGFELNADYIAIERNRRAKELGIFNKWGQ